ncbi:MAG: carbohydrate ABC transporter permease [Candidatus Methanomethylicaceae archaeon]
MRRRKQGAPWYLYLTLVVLLVLSLFPTYWIVVTSLKTRVQAIAIPPVWFFKPVFSNYAKVFSDPAFVRGFTNSLITSTLAVFLSALIGIPAAYALARYKFRAKNNLLFWILSTRMAPPIAVIIPFFLLFKNLRMLDSRISLVTVYLTFNLSFLIWMMKGFFEEIPQELEEAALVDGATDFIAFAKIALPLAAPGIVASVILSFLFSWNEFFFALILTRKVAQTLPVMVSGYIGFMGIEWERMSAATAATLPVLALAMLVQRHLVRGLTMGAIK